MPREKHLQPFTFVMFSHRPGSGIGSVSPRGLREWLEISDKASLHCRLVNWKPGDQEPKEEWGKEDHEA